MADLIRPHKKPPDLSQTPWNLQKIYEEATSKELNAELRRAINRGDEIPREYKLQTPGEKVELTGMQKHEALNGCSGEVMSRVADDQGYLMVRVQMTTGTKNMKIQPRCLKPIRHPKDGRTRGATLTSFAANPEALSVLSSTPGTSLSAAVQSILSAHAVNGSSNLSKAPLEAIRAHAANDSSNLSKAPLEAIRAHTANDSSNLSKAPLEAIRETRRPE